MYCKPLINKSIVLGSNRVYIRIVERKWKLLFRV